MQIIEESVATMTPEEIIEQKKRELAEKFTKKVKPANGKT